MSSKELLRPRYKPAEGRGACAKQSTQLPQTAKLQPSAGELDTPGLPPRAVAYYGIKLFYERQ